MLPIRWNQTSTVSPFDRLFGLYQELDRVFDRARWERWGDFTSPADQPIWSLPVDLVETPEEYRYVFEVPGFSRDDLNVTVENGVLTVSAERTVPADGSGDGDTRRHRYTERRIGRFERSLGLPANATVDEVDAVCENGLLTVTVPKSQHARPRRIEIGSGGEARRLAEATA